MKNIQKSVPDFIQQNLTIRIAFLTAACRENLQH